MTENNQLYYFSMFTIRNALVLIATSKSRPTI